MGGENRFAVSELCHSGNSPEVLLLKKMMRNISLCQSCLYFILVSDKVNDGYKKLSQLLNLFDKDSFFNLRAYIELKLMALPKVMLFA